MKKKKNHHKPKKRKHRRLEHKLPQRLTKSKSYLYVMDSWQLTEEFTSHTVKALAALTLLLGHLLYVVVSVPFNGFQTSLHFFWNQVKLLFKLTFQLLHFLGLSWPWMRSLFWFSIFFCALLPAFLIVCAWYVGSKHVLKHISYGPQPRNKLDIYLPKLPAPPSGYPVVVFVSGGAWVIGYKAWGALMGRQLRNYGVLFVTPDYRNFPQATMGPMLNDVNRAVVWVKENIHQYGGDPTQIWLVGQSAGAHLATMSILQQVYLRLSMSSDVVLSPVISPTPPPATASTSSGSSDIDDIFSLWNPSEIAGFIGISGPYELVRMSDIILDRGLALPGLVGTDGDYRQFSPVHLLDGVCRPYLPGFVDEYIRTEAKKSKDKPSHVSPTFSKSSSSPIFASSAARGLFPPIMALLHGTNDQSAPCEMSQMLAKSMRQCNLQPLERYYQSLSHTDPILEGPMSGGEDPLLTDILWLLQKKQLAPEEPNETGSAISMADGTEKDKEEDSHDASMNNGLDMTVYYNPKLIPDINVRIARWANPF